MSDLVVGDVIQDNDPRMPNRRLEIIHFEQNDAGAIRAICNTMDRYPRGFAINVKRIFTDGKTRRHGFNRVSHYKKEL